MPIKTKEDRKEYNKLHYQKNKEKYRERDNKRRNNVRDWVRNYKQERGCSRCNENHPACLQFHHLDRDDKELTIATLVANRATIVSILKEIEKCIILCANCHAKEHYNEIKQ